MYLEAAEIAFDQMLQEDFAHPITRHLSWYACHMLWRHCEPAPAPEPPEDDGVCLIYYIISRFIGLLQFLHTFREVVPTK